MFVLIVECRTGNVATNVLACQTVSLAKVYDTDRFSFYCTVVPSSACVMCMLKSFTTIILMVSLHAFFNSSKRF